MSGDDDTERTLVATDLRDPPVYLFLISYIGDALKLSSYVLVSAEFTAAHYLAITRTKPHVEDEDAVRRARIAFENFQGFVATSREMEIVYAVAVFDSFLNNITRFVYAKCAKQVLGNVTIEARQLIGKTRSEILGDLIAKKADTLARQSFTQRIHSLEQLLGQPFEISASDVEMLKAITKLRNTLIHDVSSYAMSFDETINVTVRGPTKSQTWDYNVDRKVFHRCCYHIYRGVVENLLKRALSDSERRSLRAIYDPEVDDVPTGPSQEL